MLKNLIAVFLFPVTCLAQNVGVGISPTKGRLEVNGAVGRTNAIFGGEGAGISIQSNNPAIGFNQYFGDLGRNISAGGGWVKWLDMNTGSLNFDIYPQAANPNVNLFVPTRRLTIRQNGNVSVNAPEANATLFVGGETIGLPSAIFRGSQYHSIFYEQSSVGNTNRNTYISGGKNGSLVYINDKLGGTVRIGGGTTKVGINIDPTDILEVKQVNGRGLALINQSFAYWQFFVEKNLTENASDLYVYFGENNLGNFYQGDGKYYHYSDRRVKTNIVPISSVLEGVLALRPCTYEMKYTNPGHIKSMGLIAQEVNAVFPEITHHMIGEDHGYPGLSDLYTMNYEALGPLALKAIQEQQQKITLLRLQITQLHNRISAAENVLAASQKVRISN